MNKYLKENSYSTSLTTKIGIVLADNAELKGDNHRIEKQQNILDHNDSKKSTLCAFLRKQQNVYLNILLEKYLRTFVKNHTHDQREKDLCTAFLDHKIYVEGIRSDEILMSVQNRNDANIHYSTLRTCFGTSNWRSSQLGHRHIDKGIYLDQVLRWFEEFLPGRFLFLPVDGPNGFKYAQKNVLQDIMLFLNLSFSSYHDIPENKEVYRKNINPNKFYRSAHNISHLYKDLEMIREFYRPYNLLLEHLLSKRLYLN